MKKASILSELQTQRPSWMAFEEAAANRKIGYIRADYDGYRWWNTVWPYSNVLATPETDYEIDEVYSRLIAADAFPDLAALRRFCFQHMEAAYDECRDEYNFYYTGVHCVFWIRCITRGRDYNLYLSAYVKENPHG